MYDRDAVDTVDAVDAVGAADAVDAIITYVEVGGVVLRLVAKSHTRSAVEFVFVQGAAIVIDCYSSHGEQ